MTAPEESFTVPWSWAAPVCASAEPAVKATHNAVSKARVSIDCLPYDLVGSINYIPGAFGGQAKYRRNSTVKNMALTGALTYFRGRERINELSLAGFSRQDVSIEFPGLLLGNGQGSPLIA